MQRIVGLDLGSKTVGVAQSDLLKTIASPVKTIHFEEDDYKSALSQVVALLKELKSFEVVLGLPKHMNGDIGIRGEISLDFKSELEKHDITVHLWDERLSTKSASNVLIEADMSRKKRKEVIDQVAAVIILQSYLDSN